MKVSDFFVFKRKMKLEWWERKGTVCDLTCLPLGFGIWNEGRDWKNGNRLDFLCSGLAPDGKVSKLYSTTLFRVSFPCGTSSFYFYLS